MKGFISCLCLALLANCRSEPETLRYEILSTLPHDPSSYTQGLEFAHGRLYESSGHYQISNLRITDPNTGEVLRKRPVAPQLFAEGITVFQHRLWMISWKEQTASVYDPETLAPITSHTYQGEGWGLTHDDKHLIMSNGTARLQFIDPETFKTIRTIEVTRDGQPVTWLNELEMARGHLWANIYMRDEIIRIDPKSGKVTGSLQLAGLRHQLPKPHQAEVLNGIAIHPETGHLWVTGKYWPKLFELRLIQPN